MRYLYKKYIFTILYLAVVFFLVKPTVVYSEVFSVPKGTYIQFKYQIAFVEVEGKFIIENSFFNLDKKEPENSDFNLTFDLKKSSAGFPFATQVMLGKSVLFAEKYPLMVFKSKEIKFANGQFEILGELMIKGITQVIKLLAEPIAFDPKALEPESEFDFKISARINRNDFNAGAFSGIVSDRIFLNSRLKLERIR